jgi:hypothetical protein
MKLIAIPPLSPERRAQLRQETIETCLRYGLNLEHAQTFADAFERDPRAAHLSLPDEISRRFQKALATMIPMVYPAPVRTQGGLYEHRMAYNC